MKQSNRTAGTHNRKMLHFTPNYFFQNGRKEKNASEPL